MRSLKKYSMMVFLIGAGLSVQHCGGASSSNSPGSYQGAGSLWSATLNPSGNTFTLTHAASVGGAVDQTINGTYATASDGFLVMTVTSSSGTNSTNLPAAGATANALNIPGFMLFVAPIGATNGQNVIPMIATGNCPTSTLTLDWLQVKPQSSWTVGSSPAAGQFTFDPSTGAANVTSSYPLGLPSNQGAQSLGTGTCSNGVISGIGSGGNTADVFLTASGGAVVHTQTNGETTGSLGSDGIVFGLTTPSSATNPAALAGTYIGLAFGVGNNSATNNSTAPISVTFTANGNSLTGNAAVVTNVSTGAVSSTAGAQLVINNNSGPSSGNLLTGTIDTTGPTGGGTAKTTLTCLFQQNAGGTSHTILSCDGTDQSDHFFSMVFISTSP
jgi:hypothetical protein